MASIMKVIEPHYPLAEEQKKKLLRLAVLVVFAALIIWAFLRVKGTF